MNKNFEVNIEFSEINDILLNANYTKLFEELKEIKSNSFSSTEMLFDLVYLLHQNCKRDAKLESLIGLKVIGLIRYCESIGLIIKT